ncbi:MAG TPA: hypothetical protein VK548_24110 [Candidatus Acidoferrum sp.]|nr:hypothetical protein [Candidatus Acidoferrum sp.]
MSGFGTFMTQQAACANKVAIVASSPALTGLMNAVLSNWGCSVHEGFTSWPANFTPLALATDSTVPHIFTAGDGTTGFPYILARGVTPVAGGTVKVCKVAGLGVPVGMTFQFDVGGTMVPVPAGPPPGGYCVVVDRPFPVGTSVTVSEMIPLHHVVSSIVVEPPPPTKPNPATGSVDVVIGKGVTEVTFTDKHTGFIEICKKGHVTGSFKFSVNPGALGVVVPAGACSPAIEVAAGQVTIRELSVAPGTMVGCATIPASQLVNCSPGTLTATVNVAPGDVSAQTIVFITNRPLLPDLTTLGTQSGAHEHGQPQR